MESQVSSEPSPILYSLPVGANIPSSTKELRNPSFLNSYKVSPSPSIKTLQDLYLSSFALNSEKPFLGTSNSIKYEFKSYEEVKNLSVSFASGLLELDLVPTQFNETSGNKLLGILSKNCEKWAVADFGCTIFGIVTVPFYDTLGYNATEFILAQTQLTTILVQNDDLIVRMIDLKCQGKAGNLQNVICFEETSDDILDWASGQDLKIFTFEKVLASGRLKPAGFPELFPESLFTLSYTSGTTGVPKGVMITHGMMIAQITGVSEVIKLNSDDVHISYLPLAHIFDRIMGNLMILNGARIGYYSGDVLKLKDDLNLLKPTVFACVPRLFVRFYEAIKQSLNSFTDAKGRFIQKALKWKLDALDRRAQVKSYLLDRMIFKNYAALIGGRVRIGIVGSAPIDENVLNLLKVAFSCQIIEAYGQTENSGAATLTRYTDPKSGHVGGPLSFISLRLADIPEMNYFSSASSPCGEICLRGPGVTPGYFRNPEQTSLAIDSEGWLHTGDIGRLLPNGSFQIIDRKKNLFKLSQGEYLAPEKLENVYLTSKYVAFVFVHGNSFKSFPVAVVVPDQIKVQSFAQLQGIFKNWEDLCRDETVIQEILRDMKKVGRASNLNGFELVKKIYLHPQIIGVESGLLTPTFKIKRFEMKNFFTQQIDQMYENEE